MHCYQDLVDYVIHDKNTIVNLQPTSFPPPQNGKSLDSLLVIVQHPAPVSRASPEVTTELKLSTASIDATNLSSQQNGGEVWV